MQKRRAKKRKFAKNVDMLVKVRLYLDFLIPAIDFLLFYINMVIKVVIHFKSTKDNVLVCCLASIN